MTRTSIPWRSVIHMIAMVGRTAIRAHRFDHGRPQAKADLQWTLLLHAFPWATMVSLHSPFVRSRYRPPATRNHTSPRLWRLPCRLQCQLIRTPGPVRLLPAHFHFLDKRHPMATLMRRTIDIPHLHKFVLICLEENLDRILKAAPCNGRHFLRMPLCHPSKADYVQLVAPISIRTIPHANRTDNNLLFQKCHHFRHIMLITQPLSIAATATRQTICHRPELEHNHLPFKETA